VPVSLPPDYSLADVSMNRQTHLVEQLYESPLDPTGSVSKGVFTLSQSPTLELEMIGPTTSISQFMVGDTVVEWASGGWFVPPGADQQEWDASAPIFKFRWGQDGFYFTLTFINNGTVDPAYLSLEDMQSMVEIVIGTKWNFPWRSSNERLPGIEEAEQAAGVHFLEPNNVPFGFAFKQVVYDPDTHGVRLIYQPVKGSRIATAASLVIFEMPEAYYQFQPWEGFPMGTIEQVPIGDIAGDITGIYIDGAIVDGKYAPIDGATLIWVNQGLLLTMQFKNSINDPAQLDKLGMVDMAGSMK